MEKKELKQKIIHEMRLFLLISIYLALFLFSFTTYRKLIIGEYAVDYFQYGYDLIESMILAKIIMIGRFLKLGERFLDKSLIIPSLYKAFVFCILILCFSILEHFVKGLISGKNIEEIYNQMITIRLYEILGGLPLFFIAFLLFFGFLEIGRVIGEDKLFNLFFRRKKYQ